MAVIIKNLEDFFPEIVKYHAESMNQLGENFCGSILKTTVYLKNQEKINLVAKQPVDNEFAKIYTNVNYTFRNELNFYQEMLPTLNKFLGQEKLPEINFFPKFYGGRLNLTDNLTPSCDAIILMEDLGESGFKIPDKNKGFNLEEMKFILARLAFFHSTSLAFKIKHPEEFQEKFGPYLDEFYVRQIRKNEDLRATDQRMNLIWQVIKDEEEFKPNLGKLKEMIENCRENLKHPKNHAYYHQGPFATLIHSDIWFNNLLVKYEAGRMSEVMFLDLQSLEHASIARDLLFFVFINSKDEVLSNHFQDILSFYYLEFSKNMKIINCECNFSYEIFKDEVKKIGAEQGFLDYTEALNAVFQSAQFQRRVTEIGAEDIWQNEFSETARKRICLITKMYVKEKWI